MEYNVFCFFPQPTLINDDLHSFVQFLNLSRVSRCWRRAGGGQSAPIPATGQRRIWRSSVLSSASQENSPFFPQPQSSKYYCNEGNFRGEKKSTCRHQTYQHESAVEKRWGFGEIRPLKIPTQNSF